MIAPRLKGIASDVLKHVRIKNKRRALFIVLPLVFLLLEVPTTAHALFGFTDAGAAITTFFKCAGDPIQCALSAAGYAIFEFVGVFLGVVAWLFNYVIVKTVFGFGTLFGNSAGVLAGWGVLRDVSNIALLFGFVFMGIATILDIHGYEMKKTLPRLIIFAVLLNFSLLASEAIIDTSNLFSSVLYSQSAANQNRLCNQGNIIGNNGGGGAGISDCGTNIGIAGMIMGDSRANTVLSPGFNTEFGLTLYLGLTIVETVLMVVLLAGAIMLIVRAVVLVFLMVLSPIGFAGLAVPFLEPYAKLWWNKLLSQSFFAPVFLLLIFIGLKIGESLPAQLNAPGDLAALFKPFDQSSPPTLDVLLIYVLVVGFLIAALMAAKQMGAYGANFATSFATKVVSAPFAWAGRNTVGLGAHYGAKGWNRVAGGVAKRYGTLAPTSLPGRVGKWVGGRAGETVDLAVHGTLAKVAGAKIGGVSYDERRKEVLGRAKETGLAAETASLKKAIAENRLGDAEGIAQKMNLSALEESAKTMNEEQIMGLAKILTPEKFEKLMDSKDMPEGTQHIMLDARFSDVLSGATDVKNLAAKDLEQLAKANAAAFEAFITDEDPTTGKSALKEEQLDALGKSDRLSDVLRKLARDNTAVGRVDVQITQATQGQAANLNLVNKLLDNMSNKQKATLKSETLINPNVVAKIDQNDLEALMAERKLSNTQRTNIINQLDTAYRRNPADPRLVEIDHYFTKNTFAAGQWGWRGAQQPPPPQQPPPAPPRQPYRPANPQPRNRPRYPQPSP
jgi:hypothetical protein